jgi:hypothetical protein
MKTMRFAAAAVAAAGMLAGACQAAAAIMLARYEGLIYSGSDTADVFGLGGHLTGARFVATFTYDSARFGPWGYYQDDGPDYWFEGIWGELADAPILAFSLEINGHTDAMTFGPDMDYSQAQQFTYHDDIGDRLGSFVRAHNSSTNLLANTVLDTWMTGTAPHTLAEPWSGTGWMSGWSEATFTRYLFSDGAVSRYDMQGKTTRLTVTAVVPEPAAWALMILGFGGAGAMLRRARAQRATVA